jgi:hypothetical protein
MLSPFPGMNPYLEQPSFWSSFHNRFMVAIANAIEPQLSDRTTLLVKRGLLGDGLNTPPDRSQ